MLRQFNLHRIGRSSDGTHRYLLCRRRLHSDLVAGSHRAPDDDDDHYPALAFDRPVVCATQDLLEWSGVEPVDLPTWISKTSDLDHGVVTEVEPCVASTMA